jgi:hypothetical protein
LPWNYCPCKLFSEHHCKNGLNGSFLNDNPCKSLYNNHWSIEHPCMNSYPWNVFMGHTWKACSIWSVHHIPEWFRIYNEPHSFIFTPWSPFIAVWWIQKIGIDLVFNIICTNVFLMKNKAW